MLQSLKQKKNNILTITTTQDLSRNLELSVKKDVQAVFERRFIKDFLNGIKIR